MNNERKRALKEVLSGRLTSIQEQLSQEEVKDQTSTNKPLPERRIRDNYRSAYRSEYYNEGLDINQQSQEFWEDIL